VSGLPDRKLLGTPPEVSLYKCVYCKCVCVCVCGGRGGGWDVRARWDFFCKIAGSTLAKCPFLFKEHWRGWGKKDTERGRTMPLTAGHVDPTRQHQRDTLMGSRETNTHKLLERTDFYFICWT